MLAALAYNTGMEASYTYPILNVYEKCAMHCKHHCHACDYLVPEKSRLQSQNN